MGRTTSEGLRRQPSVGGTYLGLSGHHRKITFQDELRAFLRRHEIEFDERFVWD